jgi:hypothetical protein
MQNENVLLVTLLCGDFKPGTTADGCRTDSSMEYKYFLTVFFANFA